MGKVFDKIEPFFWIVGNWGISRLKSIITNSNLCSSGLKLVSWGKKCRKLRQYKLQSGKTDQFWERLCSSRGIVSFGHGMNGSRGDILNYGFTMMR